MTIKKKSHEELEKSGLFWGRVITCIIIGSMIYAFVRIVGAL